MSRAATWLHQIGDRRETVPECGPIEYGIPIPASKRGDGTLKKHMEELKVGGSFHTSYTATACYRMAKKLGITVVTRPFGKRVRCWRTA